MPRKLVKKSVLTQNGIPKGLCSFGRVQRNSLWLGVGQSPAVTKRFAREGAPYKLVHVTSRVRRGRTLFAPTNRFMFSYTNDIIITQFAGGGTPPLHYIVRINTKSPKAKLSGFDVISYLITLTLITPSTALILPSTVGGTSPVTSSIV